MQALGTKLGEGATAEVYEFGEGTVVKLVKPAIAASVIEYEAWVTRTVSEVGALTPAVGELVDVDGRRGFLMQRIDGRPLLEAIMTGEVTAEDGGRILAELSHELHSVPGSETSLRTFHDYAFPMLGQLAGSGHPEPVLTEARRILEGLDRGLAICHGDLNPNNVLMTADGPRIIDWISAMRGNPLVDLARIAVTFSVVQIPASLHPGMTTDEFWALRLAFLSAYLATYADLANTTTTTLEAKLVPWMTVMATLALDEGTAEQQAWLVRYLRERMDEAE